MILPNISAADEYADSLPLILLMLEISLGLSSASPWAYR